MTGHDAGARGISRPRHAALRTLAPASTINLVLISAAGHLQASAFWDIALRDLGLLLAALALARLAAVHAPMPFRGSRHKT